MPISTADAAKRHGVNVRRIQKLIQQQRIPGAEMIGGVWVLPNDFVILAPPKRRRAPMKIVTTER